MIQMSRGTLRQTANQTEDLDRTTAMSRCWPLPRVNEISHAVDDDPRACYFKQVLYGKFVRESLILKLLEAKA